MIASVWLFPGFMGALALASEPGLLCTSAQMRPSAFELFVSASTAQAQLSINSNEDPSVSLSLECKVLPPEQAPERRNWLVCTPSAPSRDNYLVRVFSQQKENQYFASVRGSVKRSGRWVEIEKNQGRLECVIVR
jgi:hypothetical protein